MAVCAIPGARVPVVRLAFPRSDPLPSSRMSALGAGGPPMSLPWPGRAHHAWSYSEPKDGRIWWLRALTLQPLSVTPPTAIGHPPTAVGYPPTTVGHPPTAGGYPPTAVSHPPTAAGHPPTAVGKPPPTAAGCPPPTDATTLSGLRAAPRDRPPPPSSPQDLAGIARRLEASIDHLSSGEGAGKRPSTLTLPYLQRLADVLWQLIHESGLQKLRPRKGKKDKDGAAAAGGEGGGGGGDAVDPLAMAGALGAAAGGVWEIDEVCGGGAAGRPTTGGGARAALRVLPAGGGGGGAWCTQKGMGPKRLDFLQFRKFLRKFLRSRTRASRVFRALGSVLG